MIENVLFFEILNIIARSQRTLWNLPCTKTGLGGTREALVDSVWGKTGYARSFWEVESKVGIKEDLKA